MPKDDGERPRAGFVERLAYHHMDLVLKAGWTAERAKHFYGGMSEEKMRSIVARARRKGFVK
jgi:hypothetical protein